MTRGTTGTAVATGATEAAPTPTRFDRRMYEIMNRRDGAAVYATAARRRLVVAAHVLLTTGTAAAWLGAVLGDSLWPVFVTFGLLVPWCFATGAINASTRGLLELRLRILDERQRAERDQVQARAHRLTTWLLFGAAVGAGSASWLGGLKAEALIFPALFGVLVVHWLMPLWVAGLRVQDEIGDEPSDGPGGDFGRE
ncbi:hypothetical protein ACWCXB_27395 [Streptomyces sp. NPDC001514]